MAKPHKLANARIEIETALPVERTIDIARQVVATQRSLKITGEGPGALRVSLNNVLGSPMMTFLVSADATADGRTRVESVIADYRTSQTTVYFIPVSGKSMEGIGVYRRFMIGFGQAMQAADPGAAVQMIERDLPAGAAPAPGPAQVPVPASVPVPFPVGHDSAAPVEQPPVPGPDVAPAFVAAATATPVPEPVGYPAASASASASAPSASPPAPMLSEGNARIAQVVGGLILVGGLIFWYATPSNVTVGPLLVILLGGVVAGIGFLIGRNASRAAADELTAKLRHERGLAGVDATAASPVIAVPLPPQEAVAAVPFPTPTPVPVPADAVVPQPSSALPPGGIPPVPLPPTPTAAAAVSEPVMDVIAPAAPAGPITSIPGLTPSAPAAAPAASAPEPTPIAQAQPDPFDPDETRVAAAPPKIEWQVVLADGRQLAVASYLRLGRDPIADPAAPGTVLVAVQDPARSLSKTHAQLQASPGELIVTDLHSTNGTSVRIDGVGEIPLTPDVGHRITGDAEIRLGDYTVLVRRQVGS